jgi:glycosyltransferase involved in cell wall biosynthesis
MKPAVSVITCTHNPRRDYLERVLQALQAQTLPTELWEFLLVDNASEQILASEIDLSWHCQLRHIREERLGLTLARIRGIKEAAADILVFVDDDNILDADYLEVAFKISKDWSIIGAWGGQIRPEFEEPPPEWTKAWLSRLAIREFEQDKWSNLLHQHETTPCGAGLCVRKMVAERYAESVRKDPRRAEMDRKGKLLTSSGDSDLAFTACDMGLGTGQFTSLKLTHLIAPERLKEEYLIKLSEGLCFSSTILEYFRGKLPGNASWRTEIFQQYKRWRMDARTRRIYDASKKGYNLALKEIYRWHNYPDS